MPNLKQVTWLTEPTTAGWKAPHDVHSRGDEVQVWRVPLNAPFSTRIRLEGLLSALGIEKAG